MAQIIITNVTKIGPGNYSVDFQKDFNATDLFYEINSVGNIWQSPIAMNGTTSPQVISLLGATNFNIRLSSNYTPPTPIVETGFLMINNTDKFLINDVDSLKYTN